jgi:hypothetical protein
MINGKHYSFESIKIALPTGFVMMAESIKYSDKKSAKVLTGMGGIPTGYGQGAYEGDCELETEREDYLLLLGVASAVGFYNLPPLVITVVYADSGNVPSTDILEVKFDEREFSGKKGDETLMVTIKGKLTKPLLTNGAPAYIPL